MTTKNNINLLSIIFAVVLIGGKSLFIGLNHNTLTDLSQNNLYVMNPIEEIHWGWFVIAGILAFSVIGIGIAYWVRFVQWLFGINRNEIFTTRNEVLLRKLGSLRIATGILMYLLLYTYIQANIFVEAPHADATPIWNYFGMGILLLIFWQIFVMARKIKEEQELTI